MADMRGWAWDCERAVADRCDERFRTTDDMKEYLTGLGWGEEPLARMIKYIERKRAHARKQKDTVKVGK